MDRAPSLESFLATDEDAVRQIQSSIEEHYPDLRRLLDGILLGFEALTSLHGEHSTFGENEWVATQQANQLGLGDDGVTLLEQARLHGDTKIGDLASEAQEHIRLAKVEAVKSYFLLAMARDYLRGLTDLLRGRVGPATAHLRLQCENAAIRWLSSQSTRHRRLTGSRWWTAVTQGIRQDVGTNI